MPAIYGQLVFFIMAVCHGYVKNKFKEANGRYIMFRDKVFTRLAQLIHWSSVN